jgi:hypothetical protein
MHTGIGLRVGLACVVASPLFSFYQMGPILVGNVGKDADLAREWPRGFPISVKFKLRKGVNLPGGVIWGKRVGRAELAPRHPRAVQAPPPVIRHHSRPYCDDAGNACAPNVSDPACDRVPRSARYSRTPTI